MRSYRRLLQTALATLMIMAASLAHATAIEKILMPGEVSQAHSKYETECVKCHDRSHRERQSTLCLDCHKDVAGDLREKKGFHGHSVKAGTECTACHNEHKGRGADIVRFDRESFEHAVSGYKLEGRHQTVACANCHISGKKYREAATTCFGCHEKQDIHRGKLGKDCAQCHNQVSFKKTDFDHSKTHFPLKDAHARATCAECHRDPSYKNTPMECVACHARDDAHKGGRGPDCGACHNTDKWKTATYDHAKLAHFALNGAHAKVTCEACHRSGDTKAKIPDQCAGCHAANDRHGGRFGDDCKQCHNEERWKDAHYDHEKQGHWELKGKHAKVDCHSCHTGPISGPKLPKDCAGCHKADDVHHGSMGTQCGSCHIEAGWREKVRFDHDMTRFPLVGLHANVGCEECHTTRAYRNTARDCFSCHKADDIHKGNLGKACATCHNPNGWKFWQFDHGKATHFALEGAHAKITCESCHVKPADEVKLSKECGDCHARDDAHHGGFGRDCARCHSSVTWRGAGIRR